MAQGLVVIEVLLVKGLSWSWSNEVGQLVFGLLQC